MLKPPVGVANSVSFNVDYDPLDTLYFAHQSKFNLLQVYINEVMLKQQETLEELKNKLKKFPDIQVYFHAAGEFNQEFVSSDYREKFFNYVDQFDEPKIIYHFDEKEDLDTIIKLVERLDAKNRLVYLENYFTLQGPLNAEKNLRKFLAIFSLVNNFETKIFPVIDIPRFFHKDVHFSNETALNWCFQVLNFFGNRRIPVLLHLIDARNSEQDRNDYCPIGEGYIPYLKIFNFLKKNQVEIEGIILEFMEKINPLKSRDNLYDFFESGE
jgi:hypothetical protein